MQSSEAPSTRFEKLASEIRADIVQGRFTPGSRLPTFQEIESSYSASRGLVQLAVERLKRDGFVDARNRRGLFVSSNPPHLKRYALVFGAARGSDNWMRFNDALLGEAHLVQQANDGREFEVFAGVGDAMLGEDVCRRLAAEVAVDRLAGLILVGGHEAVERPEFASPSLPKVFVFGDYHDNRPPRVNIDSQGWTDAALNWLSAERGRRRVALLRVTQTLEYVGPEFFTRHGLEYNPKWRQTVGRGHPEVLADLLPLLMDYPKDQRPDGLVIADDSLVEHASSTLVQMGVSIGKDLDIVAHCNWPCPVASAVPMRRIGFHAGDMLDLCIRTIDAQRAGEPVESDQAVPALWEHEVQK